MEMGEISPVELIERLTEMDFCHVAQIQGIREILALPLVQ